MTESNKESLSNLLIKFFSEDDEQALDLFFFTVKDLVFHFAYTITQSNSTSNKVVIYTFFQVFKKTKKYPVADSNDEKVKAWLLSISLIYTRQFSKNESSNTSESNSYKTISHKDNLKQILVLKTLLQLQEMQKISIYLHHKEKLSYNEIGDIFTLNQQTVKKNITNGVDQLKISLKNSGVSLTNDLIVREIEVLKLPEPNQELSNQIKTEHLMTLSLKELTAPQSKSSFMQWLIVLVLAVPVVLGIIYLANEVYDMGKNLEKKQTPKTEKPNNSVPKTNKKLWDFTKENGSDIAVIKGNWTHNPTYGFMKTDYNTTTLIQTSFSFHKDSSPLVFKINSLIFNPFVDRPINSRLCGYLTNGEKTASYKFINHITQINKKEKTPLLNGNSVEYNVYLIIHQKGIFLVDRQNQFISSMIFSEPISENNKTILSFDNIYLKRMEVESLPILPLEWDAHIHSIVSEQLPPIQAP